MRTAEEPVKQRKGTGVGKRSPLSNQTDLTQVYSDWDKKEKAAEFPAWRPYPLICGSNKYEIQLTPRVAPRLRHRSAVEIYRQPYCLE